MKLNSQFITEKIRMCYDILTSSKVLLITSNDNWIKDNNTSTLKRVNVTSINMPSCDVINVSNVLIDQAIQEQRHYTAVDTILNTI